MFLKNTSERFGSISKFLHWLIAFLVIVMVTAGWFMKDFPDSIQKNIYFFHKIIGLIILTLMVIRLIWALSNPKPLPPVGTSVIQTWLEWSAHAFLYFLIITMPLSGWIGSVASGYPPKISTWVFSLPISENKSLVKLSFQIHKILAILIIITVTLHVLAAFYHHFIRRDNILIRMMPGKN